MIKKDLEIKIKKLEETALTLEKEISNLINYIEHIKNKSGEIFELPGYKIFVTSNFQYYKLIEHEDGSITKNIPKKSERKEIKKQIKNILNGRRPIGKFIYEKGKMKNIENLLKQLEEDLKQKEKQLEEINEEIKNLKSEKRKAARAINQEKRKLLEEKNFKCDECGCEVKDIKYTLLEENLVLCRECWKKPQFIHYFKNEIKFEMLPRYFDLSFEDMRAIEKFIKLGKHPELEWDEPIKTIYLKDIKTWIEEGKNYLYTKELVENYLLPLGLKKSWIYELEEQAVIKPAGTIPIQVKRNKEVEAKLWDVRTIDFEKIKKWKEEKEKQTALNKALAREKISKSLKAVHNHVKLEKEKISENLKILKTYHPFLEIAFYIYHANHYAKTPRYQKYQSKIYQLKEKALIKAYKEYPELFKISFIERGDRKQLCHSCYEQSREDWYIAGAYETGYTLGEWIRKFVKPCSKCTFEKDYYSLIEFKIETPVSRFNFHIPYPNVKNLFDKNNLKKIGLNNEEAYINFGRSLEKYEALIIPFKTVIHKLESYIDQK